MTHNPNWSDIRFALAVAEDGSVNAAAKTLGVNHATVLRRVARFEETTGVTLFQRSARGYAVDPSARHILEAMRNVEAAVARFNRIAAGEAEKISGPVQITSTDSLAPHHPSLLPFAFSATSAGVHSTCRVSWSNTWCEEI